MYWEIFKYSFIPRVNLVDTRVRSLRSCGSSADNRTAIKGGQSTVAKVYCKTMRGKEIGSQDRLRDISYPKCLRKTCVFVVKFEKDRSFALSCDSRPVGRHKIWAASFLAIDE
ncbi:hypothetical protein ElyMa_006556500 [Elysia marginata]|uniref:Uncharacterized protein n=1 Tax=Elysia marginata TaxID=1093978 RepID=A0AAV4ID25_9GAST|nr:hypothetical protein ElyMa_006556500 [Elysia marginata]